MNTRMLLAALVGGVVAFLLGWLIFGLLLASYMDAHIVKYEGLMKPQEQMNLGLMFVNNLLVALLLAWALGRMGVKDFKSGVVAGAIMGFLFYLSVDLGFLAMTNLFDGPGMVVVDALANAVLTGLVGGTIGLMLGRGTAKAA